MAGMSVIINSWMSRRYNQEEEQGEPEMEQSSHHPTPSSRKCTTSYSAEPSDPVWEYGQEEYPPEKRENTEKETQEDWTQNYSERNSPTPKATNIVTPVTTNPDIPAHTETAHLIGEDTPDWRPVPMMVSGIHPKFKAITRTTDGEGKVTTSPVENVQIRMNLTSLKYEYHSIPFH